MWLRPLSTILLSSLFLFASVCAAERVAVAFVDVKFDDKAAIWSLMLDSRYDKVIAITEGINGHEKAAQELQDYLGRQNDIAKVRVNLRKLRMFSGSNVLGEPPKHESWWKTINGIFVAPAKADALREELNGNQVRIFQLAPTTEDDVQMVISSADPGSIETYMLLHGYNSRQGNMASQTRFLRNLRSWVIRNNPSAQVIFTSSMDSYAAKDGGKQPLTAIKHIFPQYDLKQAANDNFWARQLRKAYETRYTQEEFQIGSESDLEKRILEARVHPEQNEQFRANVRDYIRQVLDQYTPDQVERDVLLKRLKYTLLPEFTEATTLELADAIHVAAFHRYLDSMQQHGNGHGSGLYTVPVHYPDGNHLETTVVPFQSATGKELHGLLLKGAHRDLDLGYIKRLAGLPH
ncbi:uncharacterized protein UBRO_04456 [Ustilago bromivora]|uniref:Uncharacterized protein n=1 Tax=Ustilago bromivora TaxID=307758 RepID=A0A1K0HDV3_9BASI|nr:uncharacterized protein UBRO_04456 [Ustilago bromivora]SYW82268.1 uncharacterized protein UBRO2_04390 [Ustilago bromivora]